MNNKKNFIYALILALVVVSGLVFANRAIHNDPAPSRKPLSDANSALDEKKKWEASPDGIKLKEWKESSEGKKVQASHDKIRKQIKDFTGMEAVVSSVTFQRPDWNLSSPKLLIVKINGEPYMMQFIPKDFQELNSLKVNDNIIVKSRSAGYSPNHPYLIVSGDYIERDGKVLFKRDFNKNDGC